MAKVVVVYLSQSGFTQKYAMWIARALHCEVVDSQFVTTPDLVQARLVVYGAHAKNSGVMGFRQFYARFQLSLPQQMIVFGTGIQPAAQLDLPGIRERTFRKCRREPQLFYFNGQVDESALPLRLKLPYHYHQRKLTEAPPRCGVRTILPLLEAVDRLDEKGLL